MLKPINFGADNILYSVKDRKKEAANGSAVKARKQISQGPMKRYPNSVFFLIWDLFAMIIYLIFVN